MNDDPTLNLQHAISKLSIALRHLGWQQARRFGLTPTQAQLVTTIGASSGLISQREAAARMALTAPTLSQAVRALEEKGLVERSRSEQDARVQQLSLTERGRNLLPKLNLIPEDVAGMLRMMPTDQRDALSLALQQLIRSLQERGAISVARMCSQCSHFRPHAHPSGAKPHHCGLVDAPLGAGDLRFDCPDHVALPESDRQRVWQLFIDGAPAA